MKLRNFIIVLLAALMVFAFASCNNEPKVNPDPKPSEYEPTDSTVYQIKVTEGVVGHDKHNNRDKLKIEWDETINEGDTITLKFRSERDIFQYDIRNGSDKWVYEGSKNGFEDPVLGDGGWYTLTYTFGAKKHDGTTAMTYPQNHFGIYFRAHFLDNDLFELMDIVLTHVDDFGNETEKELTVTSANVKSSAALVEGFDGEDHIWTIEKNYPVFFVLDTDHDTDEYWLAAQKVKAGGLATPFKKDGYTYRFFKDKGQTEAFDFSTPINEITYIFYEQTANTNTIKFDLNGGSAKEGEADAFADQAVATKGTVVMPEAEPVIADKLFAAWCTDAAGTKPYDFTTEVTGDLTLYAKYDDPIIVTFDKNDGSEDTVRLFTEKVLSGKTVAKPADDPVNGENYFAGWFLGEATESYDFATPVIENITLKAKWMEPVVVTLDPNYKIDEVAVEATTTKTGYGAKMTQPADPAEREGYVFDKWTTDAAGTTEYVFGDDGEPVTKAFTLYARWIKTRTVTLYRNFPEDTEDVVFKAYVVADGVAVDNPEECIAYKGGYVVGKWTTDKAGTNDAYDFATAVTADIPLYAQWEKGKIAQLVSTFNRADSKDNYDKFRVKFTSGDYKQAVEGGDVLTFRFRSTTPITHFNVRGDKKWIYQQKLNETYVTKLVVGDDGWTYVTYTFPKADGTNAFDDNQGTIPEDFYESERTFYFDFISYTIVKGDIIEVQGMALNGKELKIDGGNTQSGDSNVKPDYNSVKSEYAWSKQTVTFNTGVADAIDPLLVDFGGRATAPETDPSKDGYVFAGWFADAEFKKEFDFANTPITDATTIYAWLGVKKVLSFDSQEGSAVDPIDVAEGAPIDEPEEPTRLGFLFDGWYTDEAGTNKFDFDAGITADTKVYAKWIAAKTVTLNANYGNTPETRVVYVAGGDVIGAPKGFAQIGYYFAGWCDDSDGTIDHDFTKAITTDTTLYAKYTKATKGYKFTAKTEAKDRWQFRWKAEKVAALANLEEGDVFTFQVKFSHVDGSSDPATYRLRTNDNSHIISPKEYTSLGTAVDGWYTISVVVPAGSLSDSDVTGIQLAFFRSSGNIQIGDTIEIKNVTYNGVELKMTDSTSEGLYPGQKADQSSFDL
jgi:uncharacterized repeat protein (TIGR02543 family)